MVTYYNRNADRNWRRLDSSFSQEALEPSGDIVQVATGDDLQSGIKNITQSAVKSQGYLGAVITSIITLADNEILTPSLDRSGGGQQLGPTTASRPVC
ncbi:hypothetical protein EVAR_50515_1 [Eumeta japonica]|uniref:Uncharacterized protein n=1 Tax=Eumeta variegata TaxID=151549 RepID=A0A4C1X547_EUMVA|nr:hypothetical protein EVAR_50515_1 [Eumeta japonica]